MKPSRFALAALAGLMALSLATAANADELPRMDPDKGVVCFTDQDGVPWRAQCEDAATGKPGRCLVAVNGELDAQGKWIRGLERARWCTQSDDSLAALAAKGYPIVRAVADAPRGWMRDERGRIFQVTFDLRRRMYAGVSWAPTLRSADGSGKELGRTALDIGLFEYEDSTGDARAGYRHRLHLVEGSVELAPFGADLTMLRYDFSRRRSDPLFRITTFFGAPRRHDIDANLGGWIELGHVQTGEVAPDRTETLWRYGTAHLTWDLWRSSDLESYLRVRGGAGLEKAREDGEADREAVTWAGAVEGDLTLGADGFNRLGFVAQLERPTYFSRTPGERSSARRAQAEVGFERIILAINDQPVTVRIAGEAGYRNDVPGVAAGWDLRAIAGLRVNLWAPPR